MYLHYILFNLHIFFSLQRKKVKNNFICIMCAIISESHTRNTHTRTHLCLGSQKYALAVFLLPGKGFRFVARRARFVN